MNYRKSILIVVGRDQDENTKNHYSFAFIRCCYPVMHCWDDKFLFIYTQKNKHIISF